MTFEVARTAAAGVRSAGTPLARALMSERVAWAHARAGEDQHTDRALGVADDHFADDARGEQEPAWTYRLDRTEMDVMAGRVYVELARPLRSEPLLNRALAGYADDHVRE